MHLRACPKDRRAEHRALFYQSGRTELGCTLVPLLRYNAIPASGPERLAHLTASEYLSCRHVGEAQFRSFFKFAFVRNPWARLVSEYKYGGYIRRYEFKQFLADGLPEPGWRDAYRHVLPQSAFLFDELGNQLVDFVGRFESLQEDFDSVCNRLNIACGRLPHVNQSLAEDRVSDSIVKRVKDLAVKSIYGRRIRERIRGHYTKFYDGESRAFVEHYYRSDIERFGYTFGS